VSQKPFFRPKSLSAVPKKSIEKYKFQIMDFNEESNSNSRLALITNEIGNTGQCHLLHNWSMFNEIWGNQGRPEGAKERFQLLRDSGSLGVVEATV
jgi:hypothetical protein